VNNQATLSIESTYNPSTAERTTEHGRLFGCSLTPHASSLKPVPGCLLFPVLWASEPARSDDETSYYFYSKKYWGQSPRFFMHKFVSSCSTERMSQSSIKLGQRS
jgi:hypothetical protein